jgi:hypothetical protein
VTDAQGTSTVVDPARGPFRVLIVGLCMWVGGVGLGFVFSAFPSWGIHGAGWGVLALFLMFVGFAGFVVTVVGFIVWLGRRRRR